VHEDESRAEVLTGGVANAGRVHRMGDRVVRPRSPHHEAIDAVLHHVRARGFTGAPRPRAVRPDGDEELDFIPGDVATLPFPAWALHDRWLASTAVLLRRFHDATAGFVPPAGATWCEEMRDPSGIAEVVNHNDVCLENVVCRAGEAVALLDFDFAAPGRRLWDLATFARMCVPMEADEDAARTGRGGLDAGARLRVVADAYGLAPGRGELVTIIGGQIEDSGEFLRRRVAAGEAAFVALWELLGGEERLVRRRRWFAAHADALRAAVG
jgi:hypothetical protein